MSHSSLWFIVVLAAFTAACGSVESKPPGATNGATNGTTANNSTTNNGATNNPSNNGPTNNGSTNNPSNNGVTSGGDQLFEVDGDGVLSSDEISRGCQAAEACNQAQFNEQFESVSVCVSETEQQIETVVSGASEDCVEPTHRFLECTLSASICRDGQLDRDDIAAEECDGAFQASGCNG